MINLSNEINKNLILHLFRDNHSAFFEAKIYNYMDIQYIYDATKKALEGSPYRLDDPHHMMFFIKDNYNKVQFEYNGIDRKGEDVDIVVTFNNGICNEVSVEIPMGGGYIQYEGYDI